MLTNASISGIFSTSFSSSSLTPLYQVFICKTHVLPQLYHFWDTFWVELAAKGPYKAGISGMRLKLQELQEKNTEAQKIRSEKRQSWKEIDGVLHHKSLSYVPELIKTELISRHHDNQLAGHFGIEKTQELVAKKYYWETLRRNVKNYVKGYDVCLASKAVR